MKVVSALAAAFAALGLCVSAATASPASRQSAHAGSFCGTAKGIARYLSQSLKLTASGVAASTPANLKLTYTTVVNHEGALLASAPSSLKPSLTKTFSFVNVVKSDFQKADWQIAKLTPYFPALVAKGNAAAKPIAAVKTYLDDTCHLPI